MAEQRVFGLHPVQTLLTESPGRILRLWLDERRTDKRLRKLGDLAAGRGVDVTWVAKPELDRLADGARHQGAVAEVAGAAPRNEAFLENLLTTLEVPPLLLVLDGVQDPHNLGACLRTADACGVHAVVTPRDRACGLTPVVRKVASGAAETVPLVQVTNLARTLRGIADAGVFIVGSDAGQDSGDLYAADLTGPLALVMGAEGHGLRRLTREACDRLVHIPMHGAVESLNVSVATGVCLYEALRQRRS